MRLTLGVITGAVGVRGDVRAHLFTPHHDRLMHYTTLGDTTGTRMLRVSRVVPLGDAASGDARLSLAGIITRDAAEALKGCALCIDRAELPPLDDDVFYHADLVGCAVLADTGQHLGQVRAVVNYGAQDILDVVGDSTTSPEVADALVPFTRDAVPYIDLGGRVVHVVAALCSFSAPSKPARPARVRAAGKPASDIAP